MIKSMTAYGRAIYTSSVGRFEVEIQSVNRKHLDIQVDLPQELSCFEIQLRKQVARLIGRGRIKLSIRIEYADEIPLKVQPNIPLAKKFYKGWKALFKAIDIEENPQIIFQSFAKKEDLLQVVASQKECKKFLSPLLKATDQATESLLKMKVKEGKSLLKDFKKRLNFLRKDILLIEKRSSLFAQEYEKKLKAKMKEMLVNGVEEEIFLKEVAIFVDKIDLTEEIVRFKTHLDHFDEMLQTKEGEKGKTLDFILQELFREINTIGSKTQDSLIAKKVIRCKTEIEKMREQVQNVE